MGEKKERREREGRGEAGDREKRRGAGMGGKAEGKGKCEGRGRKGKKNAVSESLGTLKGKPWRRCWARQALHPPEPPDPDTLSPTT